MSRPVLPDPAGASTIQERVTSRACSRSCASGVGVADCGEETRSSGWCCTRRSSAMDLLLMVAVAGGIGVVFVIGMIGEGCGIEAAEQALRAVLAGLWIALGMDAGVAGVKVLG